MGVTIQLDKFNRCAKECSGFLRLGHALRRCAVSSSFAPRADNEMRRATGAVFFRDDATAAEFDVVGMRAEGQ
jgi:hypothetical protein